MKMLVLSTLQRNNAKGIKLILHRVNMYTHTHTHRYICTHTSIHMDAMHVLTKAYTVYKYADVHVFTPGSWDAVVMAMLLEGTGVDAAGTSIECSELISGAH